jgi:hypothetical protein
MNHTPTTASSIQSGSSCRHVHKCSGLKAAFLRRHLAMCPKQNKRCCQISKASFRCARIILAEETLPVSGLSQLRQPHIRWLATTQNSGWQQAMLQLHTLQHNHHPDISRSSQTTSNTRCHPAKSTHAPVAQHGNHEPSGCNILGTVAGNRFGSS